MVVCRTFPEESFDGQEGESALQAFVRRVYAPFLLDRRVKVMKPGRSR
jgi:Niemann-Pick C1 protein